MFITAEDRMTNHSKHTMRQLVELIFEFQTLGGVILGVKNNSKNFGNKKDIRLLSKILNKKTLFIRNADVLVFLQVYGHVKKSDELIYSNWSLTVSIIFLKTGD